MCICAIGLTRNLAATVPKWVIPAKYRKGTAMDPVYKSGHQSEDNPYEFILSDESVDRLGDVIRVKGWQLDDFRKSPVALFQHNHDLPPIGVWENVNVVGKQLRGTLKLAKQGTSELIDTIRSLIEQRIMRAVSVGFQALEANPRKGGGYEFTKAALHEVSVVSIPANPNALAIAKALSPDVADKLFVQVDAVARSSEGQSTHSIETPNLNATRERLKAMGIDY